MNYYHVNLRVPYVIKLFLNVIDLRHKYSNIHLFGHANVSHSWRTSIVLAIVLEWKSDSNIIHVVCWLRTSSMYTLRSTWIDDWMNWRFASFVSQGTVVRAWDPAWCCCQRIEVRSGWFCNLFIWSLTYVAQDVIRRVWCCVE